MLSDVSLTLVVFVAIIAVVLAVRATISYALSPPDRDPEVVARDVAGILAGALATKRTRGQGGSP